MYYYDLKKVQAYNSWTTKFWFKYPTRLIWYRVIVQLLNGHLRAGILVFDKMNMFSHVLLC